MPLPRLLAAAGCAAAALGDIALSGGVTKNHLTLWMLGLHACYYGTAEANPKRGVQALQGASFVGAHVVLAGYFWMVANNPGMEPQLLKDHMPLLPKWMCWPRSFLLHGVPVLMAWADLLTHTAQIRVAHSGGSKDGAPAGQQAWALLSFFLVVAAYENANPNAAEEQYQVKSMPPARFVAITKAIAGVAAVVSFFSGLRPRVMAARGRVD